MPAAWSDSVTWKFERSSEAFCSSASLRRARVTQGQLLFQIDPAPYKIALSRAEAQLAQAQATLRQAEENSDVSKNFSREGFQPKSCATKRSRAPVSNSRRRRSQA